MVGAALQVARQADRPLRERTDWKRQRADAEPLGCATEPAPICCIDAFEQKPKTGEHLEDEGGDEGDHAEPVAYFREENVDERIHKHGEIGEYPEGGEGLRYVTRFVK